MPEEKPQWYVARRHMFQGEWQTPGQPLKGGKPTRAMIASRYVVAATDPDLHLIFRKFGSRPVETGSTPTESTETGTGSTTPEPNRIEHAGQGNQFHVFFQGEQITDAPLTKAKAQELLDQRLADAVSPDGADTGSTGGDEDAAVLDASTGEGVPAGAADGEEEEVGLLDIQVPDALKDKLG